MPGNTTVLVVALVGGLGLAGAGAMLLAPTDRAPAFGGEGLHIALVTPPEPPRREGPTLDVGEVVDGYEHHPYVAPPPYEPVDAWVPQDDAYQTPPPVTRVRTYRSEPEAEAEPEDQPQARQENDGGWRERPLSFGFDRPRPDWAGERRKRRERMEAAYVIRDEPLPPDARPAPGLDQIDPRARRSADMFY